MVKRFVIVCRAITTRSRIVFTSPQSFTDEARSLLRLAGPLIVNNLSISGMQFADAVMAGRLGAEALAAVAVGGSVWFLGFTVCLGLMMAISPIAARYYGAGEPEMIGRYTRQGLWLAVALGLCIFTLAQLIYNPGFQHRCLPNPAPTIQQR